MNIAKATRAQKILDRGLELVKALPYKTSLRWVFYALYQEGYYPDKKNGYNAWKALCARYRKEYKRGWHPATLADDTRARIARAGGRESLHECLVRLPADAASVADFWVDHFYQQPCYIEIWFEAKAMSGQFRYYTEDIDLVPFGGDPSIPFKWEIAKHLEDAQKYGKDITVLYFGDYDKKGLRIVDDALNDIRAWCDATFEVVRCGLTREQIERYNVPDKPDKPGKYQWEALPKEAAEEIILSSLAEHVDLDLINRVREESLEQENRWKDKIYRSVTRLIKRAGR